MSTLPAVGTSITMDITVETTSDDDFIGFVIGYDANEPSSDDADWLLIDWKQRAQTCGSEGLLLSRVSGSLDSGNDLWCKEGNVDILARGLTLGTTG